MFTEINKKNILYHNIYIYQYAFKKCLNNNIQTRVCVQNLHVIILFIQIIVLNL